MPLRRLTYPGQGVDLAFNGRVWVGTGPGPRVVRLHALTGLNTPDIETPPAPADLMTRFTRVAVTPGGRLGVISHITNPDRAVVFLSGTGWVKLGAVYGAYPVGITTDGETFRWASVTDGGGTLQVQHEDGTVTTRQTRPGGTSQGILYWEPGAPWPVLSDERRATLVGSLNLYHATTVFGWTVGEAGGAGDPDRVEVASPFSRIPLDFAATSTPRLVVDGSAVYVGYSLNGVPQVLVSTPPYVTLPEVDDLGPRHHGYFFSVGRYGLHTQYVPGNVAVVVDAGYAARYAGDVIIAPVSDKGVDLILEYAPTWRRVVALYAAAEALNKPEALTAVIERAWKRCQHLGLERRPVIAYAGRNVWPAVPAEVWGVECYQDAGEPLSSAAQRWHRQAAAVHAAGKRVAVIAGDYDRRNPLPQLTGADLLAAQPVYEEMTRAADARYLLRFSCGRPGGTLDHRALLPWHLAVHEATTVPPIVTLPWPPLPEPPTMSAKATIASFDAVVTLPGRGTAVATITQGTPTHLRWQYQDGGAWKTASEQPASDLTVEYTFPRAGQFAIRLQTLVHGQVVDTSSSTARVVTVKPGVVLPEPIPPQPPSDTPQYDTFVNVECPKVDQTYRAVHGMAPAPANMGHNSYRRLALGWTAAEVQHGIAQDVNHDRAPWFGWVPVDYDTFVGTESNEVAAAYRSVNADPAVPTPSQMGHTAWRRLAEFWTHRDILHDIKGEPLEDGGAGGERPATPPGPAVRTGRVRSNGFQFVDDGGGFLATGQSLFYGFGSYAREREHLEENLTTTKRLSHFNRMIVCGLRLKTNERSLDPKSPTFKSDITGCLNLSYDVYGQRVGVTIFGAVYPAPTEQAQNEVVDMVADAIKAAGIHKVFYVEIANEGWTNGFADDAGRDRLFRLAARFVARCPGVLVATTCPEVRPGVADDVTKEGVQYYYKGSKATLVTEHYARSEKPPDGVWRHTKKVWREKMFRVEGCPDIRMNQEPWGPESSGNEGNDPLVLAIDAVVTWLSGCGAYVLHCGAGIHGVFNPREPGVEDDRPAKLKDTVNYDAINTAIESCRNLLSPDLPNWRKHDTFSGAFDFIDVPEEQFAAAYSATSGPAGQVGERIVQPVWGVVKTTTWKLKKGTVNGRVHDPRTGAVIATFDKQFTVTPQQRAVLVLADRTS